MEFNEDLLGSVLTAVFYLLLILMATSMAITYRIKYLLKKNYPEQHKEIYDKLFPDIPFITAIKNFRFSLFRKEREFIQNKEIIAWLKFDRLISLITNPLVFLVGLFVIVRMTIGVAGGIIENGIPDIGFRDGILFWVYAAIFVVTIFTSKRVEYLIKKYHPEQYNEIYGKSSHENSIIQSIKSSLKLWRFTLSTKEWEFVQDGKILAWMKFDRFMFLTFLSLLFFIIMYVPTMFIIKLSQIYL